MPLGPGGAAGLQGVSGPQRGAHPRAHKYKQIPWVQRSTLKGRMSSPTYTDFPKYLDTPTPVRAHPLGTVRHSDSHTHTARSAQGLVGTAGSLAAPLDLCPPAAPPDGPLLTSAGTLRPQCHSRRSRASAPASCRCHRDPRARGPRPPGVAPTPAGSGRGGRTLVRLWHRPRVPTHRPPPLGDAAERYGEGVSVSATSAAQGEAGGEVLRRFPVAAYRETLL